MADIFNRAVSNLAGVFTADRAKMTFASFLAALVQNMQFSYAQTITRLYEIGSADIYYVGGRTQGGCTVARVIGPKSSVCAFYTTYGDVCTANQHHIVLTLQETNCMNGGTGGSTFTLRNCVITNVAVGLTSQEMIISENSQLMYSSLECSDQ